MAGKTPKRVHSAPGTGEYGGKRRTRRRQADASPKKPGDGPTEKSPPDFGQSIESG